MALLGQITVNGRLILDVDADPSSSGVAAPFGSIALWNTGSTGRAFIKTSSGDTGWTETPNQPGLVGDIVTIQPDDAAAAGVSTAFARADHRHAVGAAAPTTSLSATTTNAEGTGTSFARNDHTHDILTGAASSQTPDQANAEGTSANLARADHVHSVATAAPVATGTANAQGAASTFARSDHVHNTVLEELQVLASASTSTSSTTDVALDSMLLTPTIAGTYLVLFTAASVNSGNGAQRTFFVLYNNGVAVANSERVVGTAGGAYSVAAITIYINVTASTNVEIRWRAAAGTSTALGRSLTLIRTSN